MRRAGEVERSGLVGWSYLLGNPEEGQSFVLRSPVQAGVCAAEEVVALAGNCGLQLTRGCKVHRVVPPETMSSGQDGCLSYDGTVYTYDRVAPAASDEITLDPSNVPVRIVSADFAHSVLALDGSDRLWVRHLSGEDSGPRRWTLRSFQETPNGPRPLFQCVDLHKSGGVQVNVERVVLLFVT